MTQTFQSDVRQLAFNQTGGDGPGVVFLGGFRSDKEGTKAIDLENWAKEQGRAFLRFDYSGHGSSSGDFLDGAIGDWADDAEAIIKGLTTGKQILVGSSMGGWISLLLARRMPERIAGLVTIAAAPDFTEDGYWSVFDDVQKMALQTEGQIELPSEYSDEPYIITRRLIEEGRKHLVLRNPLTLPFPVRFLQGTEDTAVSTATATRLLHHAKGLDMRLTLAKGADHRFSDPECLAMIRAAVEEVSSNAVT